MLLNPLEIQKSPKFPVEAKVWVLNPYDLNKMQINDGTTPSIEGWSIRKFLRPAFTTYGLSRTISNQDDEEYLGADEVKVCAVMGVETDNRIFAQQGCFTIHTSDNPFEEFAHSNRYLKEIVIPADSIITIAKEILLCGFRKSTIYPDLANLSIDLQSRF